MSAVLSADGVYRYRLDRALYPGEPLPLMPRCDAVWIMLNPSTADATVDDLTIAKCRRFSRDQGCSDLVVVNLYAYRATLPVDLAGAWRNGTDIIGPDNDTHIRAVADATAHAGRGLVVAGWGGWQPSEEHRRAHAERIADVALMFTARGLDVHALGFTTLGQPRHPGRLAYTTPLVKAFTG